jgi:hypothetical protein
MACTAYSEHDGANRQLGGSTGLSTRWYNRTAATGTATRKGRRSASGELQRTLEFGGRLGIGELIRSRFGDHDEIDRSGQRRTPLAKNLPDDPFQAVPHDGVAHPGAHCHTEAGCIRGTGSLDDDEARRVTPSTISLEAQELPTTPHSGSLRVRS